MTPFDVAQRISEASLFRHNFVYKKSLHWRYLLYRLARPLLKVNYKVYKLTHPHTPWTSQASIRILKTLLHNKMIGFEYGSGNSTVFLARRLGHLTSVEHHETWHKKVQNNLKAYGISNIDYHLIPPKYEQQPVAYTFYRDYSLSESDFQVMREYHDYFTFISTYPPNHFDFILVDGRARVECSLFAIPRLKPGGLFVLDNSDRSRYEPVFRVLAKWKKVVTTTGLFDTTIWFKPVD